MKIQNYLILILGGGLLLMAAAGPGSTRIGVIDQDRLRSDSVSVRTEMEKIAAPARKSLAELHTKQEELNKAMDDFNRQRTVLSPELGRQKEETLRKQTQDLQELSRQIKERMDRTGAEGIAPIRQRVGNAVGELARERGLDIVLTASSVIYHKNELDLTDAVIARLDGDVKK